MNLQTIAGTMGANDKMIFPLETSVQHFLQPFNLNTYGDHFNLGDQSKIGSHTVCLQNWLSAHMPRGQTVSLTVLFLFFFHLGHNG